MLQFFLRLRYVILLGSAGAGVGALLMFYEAAVKLAGGVRMLFVSDASSSGKAVITAVMGATDACLFGIVLTFFAYAIAFGFVIQLEPATRSRLPQWVRVDSISNLKQTLIEVILVYLVVDFATDVAESETHVTWETLIMPGAILLIAAALRLMSSAHPRPSADVSGH